MVMPTWAVGRIVERAPDDADALRPRLWRRKPCRGLCRSLWHRIHRAMAFLSKIWLPIELCSSSISTPRIPTEHQPRLCLQQVRTTQNLVGERLLQLEAQIWGMFRMVDDALAIIPDVVDSPHERYIRERDLLIIKEDLDESMGMVFPL